MEVLTENHSVHSTQVFNIQALSSYLESFESYQTALPTANLTAAEKSLKSGGQKALENVMSKLLNPYTMSLVPPSPSSLHF